MKHRQRVILALVLIALVSASCATVGTGDPVVVRAEDLLTNSLTIYSQAMDFHFKNSTKETPQVYRTFENFRAGFPTAWNALDQAKRSYQSDKSKGSANVDAALNALSVLVSTVTPLIGGH